MDSSVKFFLFSRAILRPRIVFHSPICFQSSKKKNKDDDFTWAIPLIESYKENEKAAAKKEPAMLHMVYRIKPLKGQPYWEKDMMKKLSLDGPMYKPTIHKNSPSVNKDLEFVKHLIKIIPITFPNGLPEDEDDFEHCCLKDNGEFTYRKKIMPIYETDADEPPEAESLWKMDKYTLEKDLQKKLQSYRLCLEYFPAKYVYKHNQDGKEYRYHSNHNTGENRDWY